jgi:DNA repair protein RecN (Recombination protein N)
MLTLLRIAGFALIDEVELPIGAGFTVITGETGAGKSILVDALSLLRGGRASTELIRTGRDEAQVEAVFEVPADCPVRPRLAEEGRDLDEGLLVRRLIARNGRGRIHLGGSLASAADLSASVGKLVDITSQHDQQSLMDPDSQLAILDTFAGNNDTLVAAQAAWQTLAAAEAELAAFDADARTRAEREDLLRFQLTELEEANLQPGEDDALRSERERVKGAEKFLAACTRGEETLYSGEDAVAGRMAAVARDLGSLATLDPTLAPMVERLRDAQAVVEDVASDLGRYAGGVRFDPERLNEIEERLFLIGRLTRKHGGTVATVIERHQTIARDLAALGSFEEGLEGRRAVVAAARAKMTALADVLGEKRRKAARSLARKIDETLHDLGLSGARVPLEVEAKEELGPRGRDRVRFLFAPNPGEEPRPLARIASGGELSRVMLAVKQALAKADQGLTCVFDEVDSGVGGGTAEVIGRKLKAIAADRQVLAVTHLAQIAAFADHHIMVTKESTKTRTTVRIQVLDEAGHSEEIARMLAGKPPSREARAHAHEMLRRARGQAITAQP